MDVAGLEPAEARRAAAALLNAVDLLEGATRPVLDDRGQVAGLDGYEPLNP